MICNVGRLLIWCIDISDLEEMRSKSTTNNSEVEQLKKNLGDERMKKIQVQYFKPWLLVHHMVHSGVWTYSV